MADHPVDLRQGWAEVSKRQWPPVIANLRPQFVSVHEWGVAIMIEPGFDGGWGYEIPRNKEDLPKPASCYAEPGRGVFWHGPC